MSTVNAQIIDAVRQSNDMVLSQGAEFSMAATMVSAANSISLVMSNAANAEQGAQQIAQAATAVTCAMIAAQGTGSGS